MNKESYDELMKTKAGRNKVIRRNLGHFVFTVTILIFHLAIIFPRHQNPLFDYGVIVFALYMIFRDAMSAYDVWRHLTRFNNLACRTIYHQLKDGKWKSLKAIKPNSIESDRLYSLILQGLVREGLIEKSEFGYRIAPGEQARFNEVTGASKHPVPLAIRSQQTRSSRHKR